jgi:predicted transcriptional regulator
MERTPLSEQEFELLRYVADRAPVSARDAAEGFGPPRGLARTTVQTVIERVRAKGYLTREKRGGVYLYSPAEEKPALLREKIQSFVERALGGSFSPLVAYLAERRGLTNEERETLERVVERMEQMEQMEREEKEDAPGDTTAEETKAESRPESAGEGA